MYPTLSFLWHFPNILKTFVIYSPVSEYVLKGADLMLPGLCRSLSSINDLKDIKIGDIACIKVIGNPLPFAIGTSLVHWSTLQNSIEANDGKIILKGKALQVLHVYGDLLSNNTKANIIPNNGFGTSCIYSIDGKTLKQQQEEDITTNRSFK